MRAFGGYAIIKNHEFVSTSSESYSNAGTPYVLYEPRQRDYKPGNIFTSVGAGGRKGLPRRTMDPSIGMKMAVGVYVRASDKHAAGVVTNPASYLTFRIINGSHVTEDANGNFTIDAAVTPTASIDSKIRKIIVEQRITPKTVPTLSYIHDVNNYHVMAIPEGSLGEQYLDLEVWIRTGQPARLSITFDAFYAPLDSFHVNTGDRPVPKQVYIE